MSASDRPRGVLAAILTPVKADFSPDHERFIAHARWLLENGCDGLNVLGTTGEAPSFSVAQRLGLMQAIASSGLPLERMLVGTGAASLDDATILTKAAVALGFAGELVIPPFYYKDVTEAGVFAFYATLLERAADVRLRLYLYNFPRLSGVPISSAVTKRLIDAFGATVAGLKDSSGDAQYTAAMHRAFPSLDVFPSSEAELARGRTAGYAGCISASVNVTAPYCAAVWHVPDPEVFASERVAALRAAISSLPMIPALRFLVSELHRDNAWLRSVPPLVELAPDERTALLARVTAAGYGTTAGSR